jgi:hypothetical protein
MLYLIPTYEMNKHSNSLDQVYLLAGNGKRILLGQGPLFHDLNQLRSPNIVCSSTDKSFGKNFHYHFKSHYHDEYF